jgi:Domain of unknown function (DUF5664)
MAGTGDRSNRGKARWRNFPLFLVEPLIHVGAAAEKHENNPDGKYTTYNFLKGLKVDDCLDCAKRHLMKTESPDYNDLDDEFPPEKQVYHLAQVAWNCLVALHNIKTRPDLDDRYKTQLRLTKAKETVSIEKVDPNTAIVREAKFSVGDVVKHIANDVEVTVEGTYWDAKGVPVLFVKDADNKIFGVDPRFYRTIYKE